MSAFVHTQPSSVGDSGDEFCASCGYLVEMDHVVIEGIARTSKDLVFDKCSVVVGLDQEVDPVAIVGTNLTLGKMLPSTPSSVVAMLPTRVTASRTKVLGPYTFRVKIERENVAAVVRSVWVSCDPHECRRTLEANRKFAGMIEERRHSVGHRTLKNSPFQWVVLILTSRDSKLCGCP